jgi:multiple sugar transport system substrate-binding protein
MKKVLSFIASLLLVFTLTACLGGGGRGETVVNIPNALPDEIIEIEIWHAFGQDNQDLLQQMFDSFNAIYPQVRITQLSQGGYTGLRESAIQGIVSGITPTIVMGYPDHFVEYLNGNALVPMNDYINHPEFGIDLSDFVQGFLDENRQYADGLQYSLPFAKSTEMVVYNKDFFDAQGITLDWRTPMTWDQIIALGDTMIGSGPNQCPHLFNADSAANFFINSSRQWGGGYTNAQGEILVDNPQTRDMLAHFQDLFSRNIVSFPIEWDQSFGSGPFKEGLVCMTQGSTAGTRHNVPGENDKFSRIGVLPVIQKDLDNQHAIQQGPNIAIMSDADDNQRLAAWLLLRHMTNTENTAWFAMRTGYVPVRISGFENPEYQEFLQLVNRYEAGGLESLTLAERIRLPFSMAANVAYVQVEAYGFDPAFVGRTTSSGARSQAEALFESVYAGTRTIDEAIRRMLNQLGQ